MGYRDGNEPKSKKELVLERAKNMGMEVVELNGYYKLIKNGSIIGKTYSPSKALELLHMYDRRIKGMQRT